MHTYACTIRTHDELISTLYQLFDEEHAQEVSKQPPNLSVIPHTGGE